MHRPRFIAGALAPCVGRDVKIELNNDICSFDEQPTRSLRARFAAVRSLPSVHFTSGRGASSRAFFSRNSSWAPSTKVRSLVRSNEHVEIRAQQEIVWTSGTVVSNEAVAEDHHNITVKMRVKTGQEGYKPYMYGKSGQYVQLKTSEDGKPGYFAIASPPFPMMEAKRVGGSDEEMFEYSTEFLIKRTPGTAEEICDLKAGDTLSVSSTMGNGFKIIGLQYVFKYKTILMFATGSGIAPIRALIEAKDDRIGELALDFRDDVRLYYGARTPARMAYTEKFPAWTEDYGVRKIVPVISKPEGTGWEGKTGYVQDAFKEDGISDPEGTGIILCGVKGMMEEVTKLALEMGVPKENILTNF